MIIHQILKNPLVKIVGICTILYFALFADKENPSSLRNRLSKERLVSGFQEAKKKSQFIMTNVNTAQELSKRQDKEMQISKKTSDTSIIECGDEVIADYAIYKSDQNIHSVKNEKLIIGSRNNWLIEKNVIGLKTGDVANVNLLENLKIANQETLSASRGDNNLHYRVTINSIKHDAPSNIQISCE